MQRKGRAEGQSEQSRPRPKWARLPLSPTLSTTTRDGSCQQAVPGLPAPGGARPPGCHCGRGGSRISGLCSGGAAHPLAWEAGLRALGTATRVRKGHWPGKGLAVLSRRDEGTRVQKSSLGVGVGILFLKVTLKKMAFQIESSTRKPSHLHRQQECCPSRDGSSLKWCKSGLYHPQALPGLGALLGQLLGELLSAGGCLVGLPVSSPLPSSCRADLVPAYSFGENDIFWQLRFSEGSCLRRLQLWFKQRVGFAPCLFGGRGLFCSRAWGLLPLANPITVVGKNLPLTPFPISFGKK